MARNMTAVVWAVGARQKWSNIAPLSNGRPLERRRRALTGGASVLPVRLSAESGYASTGSETSGGASSFLFVVEISRGGTGGSDSRDRLNISLADTCGDVSPGALYKGRIKRFPAAILRVIGLRDAALFTDDIDAVWSVRPYDAVCESAMAQLRQPDTIRVIRREVECTNAERQATTTTMLGHERWLYTPIAITGPAERAAPVARRIGRGVTGSPRTRPSRPSPRNSRTPLRRFL